MSDEVELSMAVPLDEDGFLRRECPTCEREFKWLPSEDEDAEPSSAGGYFCPYCGVQAPDNAWWTKGQLALAENQVHREVVGPELEKFQRSLRDIGRSSEGLIKFERGRIELPPEADPLTDTEDDMRRVDFECHPKEPVKVLNTWAREVFCLSCGTLTPQSR